MAEIEAIVEPDSIGNDIGSESVSFVGINPTTLSISETQRGDTPWVNLPYDFLGTIAREVYDGNIHK